MNRVSLFFNTRKIIMAKCTIFERQMAKNFISFLVLVAMLVFFCEYAIYHIVLHQCSWPSVLEKNVEGKNMVKAMFLADTHLLGPFRGHWFDKLRREWQMQRAFQTAIHIFEPEVVFFLGDLFDEGEWVNAKGFDEYVTRFEYLFAVPQHIEVYVVAGNHDMGFHHQTGPLKNSRFRRAFNTTSVRLVIQKETNFVLINSMALEMDNCFLCEEAVVELNAIEDQLLCQKNPEASKCISRRSHVKNIPYNHPIVLQHFPLYRNSDSECSGDDSAPDDEKYLKFRETLDCLSKDSSEILLHLLKPRLILSGHTHHYCLREHYVKDVGNVAEYSLPSFSWRNRNNPSFFLGRFAGAKYELSKCMMPKETTVLRSYAVGFCLILCIYLRYLLSVIKRCFFRHKVTLRNS